MVNPPVEMSQLPPNVTQNGIHNHHPNHIQQHPQQHPNHGQQHQQHSNLEDLLGLLRTEIPEGRQTLLDTRGNLEKVADYCATTYLDVSSF